MISDNITKSKNSDVPKISIIIPVYKREKYLFQCFYSVMNQTLKDIEIIIVDKAENDTAREIIDFCCKKDSRIVAPHIVNNGYGASCNIGFSIAKGEYIMIVESDDYIKKDACEKLYEFAKKCDADVIKTPFYALSSDGKFSDCSFRKQMADLLPKERCFSAKEFGEILEIHASLWSCLYRKSYLDSNEIKFIEADGAGYVDVGFRIDTLTKTNKIAWFDFPFYFYRVDASNSSTNIWNVSVMNQRWREVHENFSKKQDDYDKFYGPHLILDEYINTVYRGHYKPLSKKEKKEIAYNLNFVKPEMIKKSKILNDLQKCEIKKILIENTIDISEASSNQQKQNIEKIENPNIKIFVCHRRNVECELVANPIYIPVLGGAVYDIEKNIKMFGDDSGDNISKKNRLYGELSVQYWAWKNEKADYYGLCHYRRFISFSDTKFDNVDDHGQIIENEHLSPLVAERYGLLDSEKMISVIRSCDGVILNTVDIGKIPTASGYHKSIYDFWTKGCINLMESDTIDKMLEIIKELYPEYYDYAINFLKNDRHRGYNIFVLKKQLFNELCQFEFDVLFELEKRLDMINYSPLMLRLQGYLGEILSAIFFLKLETEKKYKILIKQLVTFMDCAVPNTKILRPAFDKNNIPIVFVSSKENLPYLNVALNSMVEHISQEKNYDIIVLALSSEIQKDDEKCILDIERGNVKIRFYDPREMVGEPKFENLIENYITLPQYKILIPWILPFYDRAIVLDSDIIIKNDVSKLLELNFNGNCIAAVRDIVFMGLLNGAEPGWKEYAKETLEMENPYCYFNAGVLSMNLVNMRNTYSLEAMLSVMKNGHFKLADQDYLNFLYKGKTEFLDLNWNFFVKTNWWVEKCIEHAPEIAIEEYRMAEKNPFIIHFANKPKPWDYLQIPMADEFWSFARNASVYEELLFRLVYKAVSAIAYSNISCASRNTAPTFCQCVKLIIKKIVFHLPFGNKIWNFLKRILRRK